MEHSPLTADTTFPYRLFRFAHKRSLDSVSSSYFAIVSKDNNAVGLVLSIDIDEQWHHARSAATTFWQIYVREFNHSESRSTLTRFEEGLKELNKAVVKTQEKVQQPISVSAAIFENDQIHFSTIGTNRVLLARDGKFSDVTSGSDKSGNQFAAVTSGDLSPNDTIFLTNQNFYEFIASEPDELWRLSDATALSEEILSRAQNSEQALNCVLIQYDVDQPFQTTLYWEESEKRYPIAMPKLPKFSVPNLSIPKLSIPKVSLKLPKINLKILKSLKIPGLTQLKELRIRPAYIGVVLLVLAAIYGVTLIANRSSDDPAAVEQTLSEKFAGLTADDFLEAVLAETNNGNLASQSPDELTKIKQIASNHSVALVTDLNVISQTTDDITAIDGSGKQLFLVDSSGQLWQVDENGQLKQIDHQFKVINPTSILSFQEDSLVISDSLGNIWHYKGEAAGPIALSLPTQLSTGQKLIGKFAGNLYVYSRNQNAIYRQGSFNGAINSNSPYFGLSAIGNSRPVSWTINGDFLLATNDKKIVGVLRNNITLKAISYPYATAESRIFADDKQIVVATGNLLSTYSLAGKLDKQTIVVSDDEISGVYLADGFVWLALGKDLVKLSF